MRAPLLHQNAGAVPQEIEPSEWEADSRAELYRSHTPQLPLQSSVESGSLILDDGVAIMHENIMIGDGICLPKP